MQLHVVTSEDESLLIEWIGKGERYGVVIEAVDVASSCWYKVSRDEAGVNDSGYFSEQGIKALREWMNKAGQ